MARKNYPHCRISSTYPQPALMLSAPHILTKHSCLSAPHILTQHSCYQFQISSPNTHAISSTYPHPTLMLSAPHILTQHSRLTDRVVIPTYCLAIARERTKGNQMLQTVSNFLLPLATALQSSMIRVMYLTKELGWPFLRAMLLPSKMEFIHRDFPQSLD